MILREASAQDNENLIHFFSSIPVRGSLEYTILRKNDFFDIYKIQSENHLSLLLEEPPLPSIEGFANFGINDWILNGKKHKIAFGSDLRIQPSRKATLSWTKEFLPLIKQIKQTHGVDYFFSTLNLSETQAINTFLRIRPTHRHLPRYHLFRSFNLISLHGYFPWKRKSLSSIQISRGTSLDFGPLASYLQKKSSSQILHPDWSVHNFYTRLKRWKTLSIEDFFIAKNHQGRVIGCIAPWSYNQIQTLIPLSYSAQAENFRQFLKFGNFFGYSRPITKSAAKSGLTQPMELSFLTHLYADNEDIFEALLYSAWESVGPNNFLVYLANEEDLHLSPPRDWVAVSQRYGLFCILEPDSEIPEFLSPHHPGGASLEPCFV